MNREDIIRMAQEAGWKNLKNFDSEMQEFILMGNFKDLEAFAALVASAEREAILDLVDGYAKNNTDLAEAIRARGQA